MIGTYQTRITGFRGKDRPDGDAALSAYGELYGRVQRKLFAEVMAGRPAASLKNPYLREYGIPARMFNAVRVSLEGKVASVREAQKLHLDTLQRRIARAERQISDAVEQSRWQQVHQKRRRLGNLRGRLAALESDLAGEKVRLCFGSKRLWRKQHHLEANGYSSHEEWLADWQDARSGEFFVLGSRDETGGCQLCVAAVAGDGSLTLRLRMPDCLSGEHGQYLVIEGVKFAYGHEQALAALQANAEYGACRREHGERAARATGLGQALSYRFKRDGKGWRVFATTDMAEVPVTTDRRHGVIGVDLNADHLAVAETDASGNCTNSWRVPLVTYGKSRHQSEALIGDAVAGVVEYARGAGQPIVIEKLDFRQKKAALEGESLRYSRMLSSFGYGKVKAYFLSRGYRAGGGGTSGQPGLQFGGRPGEVHGTIRAQCPPGSGPGAGPAFARLLGAHSPPAGLSRGQRRPRRLHRTCKEAGEARVDVLGCGLGAAETGACSAAPAGEIARPPQSGSGCRADPWSAGWPERGPVRCSRVRFPGGAVLNCWGGGASPFGQRLRKG